MVNETFGHIEGFPTGSNFSSRIDLVQAGVHRHSQAGIAGSQNVGADSIVLSGGYEDDQDDGDTIIYTGYGGQDRNTRKQIADQKLERWNLALARSMQEGFPVRVIRGANLDSPHAPKEGYRYDGLYRVVDYWQERGESGFLVWRYRLEMIDYFEYQLPTLTYRQIRETQRVSTTILRIIRDTQLAQDVKKLYDYRCQVGEKRLEGPGGPYAEAAHIQPLGSPHNGPDVISNILCLCPNHHVLFDIGAFTIRDDFILTGSIEGKLKVKPRHTISREFLRYRRDHYSTF